MTDKKKVVKTVGYLKLDAETKALLERAAEEDCRGQIQEAQYLLREALLARFG